jgi:NADPH:quinone reductase-like Zn-dependent oxidoreductase
MTKKIHQSRRPRDRNASKPFHAAVITGSHYAVILRLIQAITIPQLAVLTPIVNQTSIETTHTHKSIMSTVLSLKGKTAIVTGGAGGLGLAITDLFLEAGANVVAIDINTFNHLKPLMTSQGQLLSKQM